MKNRTETLTQQRKQHVPHAPYNITPAFIREASGAMMIDVDGRELIDFAGGIWTQKKKNDLDLLLLHTRSVCSFNLADPNAIGTKSVQQWGNR